MALCVWIVCVCYLSTESRDAGQNGHGQHLDDQHAGPEGVRAEHLIVDGDKRSQRHDMVLCV